MATWTVSGIEDAIRESAEGPDRFGGLEPRSQPNADDLVLSGTAFGVAGPSLPGHRCRADEAWGRPFAYFVHVRFNRTGAQDPSFKTTGRSLCARQTRGAIALRHPDAISEESDPARHEGRQPTTRWHSTERFSPLWPIESPVQRLEVDRSVSKI